MRVLETKKTEAIEPTPRLEAEAGSSTVKFGAVKVIFREVSGYLGSVLTISDQNGVFWGVLEKKFLRDFNTDQNAGLIKFGLQISPNSKFGKFYQTQTGSNLVLLHTSEALYECICVLDCCGMREDNNRRHATCGLVRNHSLLLMARLGRSTLAPTTTKREITRMSLPPSRVLWRPYSCNR